MSRGENVVTIGQNNGEGRGLPATLIRLRDKTAGRFRELLTAFFDSADDALFDLSERAYSNADQTTYFDAMRELRMQRKSMTLAFQQWLTQAFNEGGRFEPVSNTSSEAEADRDSLSLVDDDTLEEQVAIDNMIMRIRNRYSEPVELIRLRMAELLKTPDLDSAHNPLGPEVICHGLAEACSELSIDIRARLVIYKLLDKLLITQLGHLYSEANQHLIDEGVLPKIRNPAPVRRAPQQQQQGHGPAHAGTGYAGGGGYQGYAGQAPGQGGGGGTDMETLLQLLHSSGSGGGMAPGGAAPGGSGGGGGFAPVQTGELVQMLSSVQVENAVPSGSLAPMVTNLVQKEDKGVRQADSDVINLVSMLFDFILEDRQLPESMKALIARLQIPMVKVALVDREFFERGGHPARKLLNELAGAAMIWSGDASSRSDPLYEHMEAAVSRIQNEFSDDVTVFESVLEDFTAFMEKDQRRRELVEQRLRDAEEGRARDEQARQAVSSVLERILSGHDIPERIQTFLRSGWFRVLKWYHLREGEEGLGWQHHCDLTERLAWTLDPQPRVRSTRPTLLREIPRVVSGIREGLRAIAWDPFDIDKCLHELELTHVDVLQQLKTAPDESEADTPASSRDHAETGDSFNITDVAPPGVEARSGSVSVEPEAVANESDSGESGALAEPEEAEVPEEEPREEEDIPDPDLNVGAWVEWRPEEGEAVRCKLAAVIRATGKYIFVNRNGARVVEYMQPEVGRALRDGILERLDDGMIFDRALESVIDSLRESKAG